LFVAEVEDNDETRDTLWINGRGRLLPLPVSNVPAHAAQERSSGEHRGDAVSHHKIH
jgi:hypothetical protein